MQPKLSIIIVNHRSEKDLEYCLRSIHSATREHVEVIVVDLSPSGGFHGRLVKTTAKQVLAKSGVTGHYFIASGEHHPANFGAEHASGQLLCFVNPRLMFGGHSLDRLVEWVEAHPRTVAGPRMFDHDGKVFTSAFPLSVHLTGGFASRHAWQPWLSWLNRDYVYAELCRTATQPELVQSIGSDCVVMSKDIWHDVGPWSQADAQVDRTWFQRAQSLGIVAWFVPTAEATMQS